VHYFVEHHLARAELAHYRERSASQK